jgi:hypothetical protein
MHIIGQYKAFMRTKATMKQGHRACRFISTSIQITSEQIDRSTGAAGLVAGWRPSADRPRSPRAVSIDRLNYDPRLAPA